MNAFAIETNKLTKRFGSVFAVNELDLQVRVGSVFGFLGRNGAGKTTTIKTLLGLIKPTSGSVHVLGMDPIKDGIEVKQRVGYVAENQKMYDWMKVKEIIRFTSGFYRDWDAAIAADFCKRFELNPSAKVGSLSKGQQMRLALMLALSSRPQLLILDDPTMGLDPITRKEFLNDIVMALQEEGRTVFFSTHILSELERVADTVAIIDRGKLKVAGEIDLLKTTVKSVRLTFENSPPNDILIDGLLRVQSDGRDCLLTLTDFSEDKLGQLKQRYQPMRAEVCNLSLDEIFAEYVLSR
ncbi:MAG: ABC transporter ATP-binding protein [Candidatus Abyssobacteria bacterium SURF_17]|uniref:ABC transporter ATP-binding protein n=1 Tax=Candidatus Abyssobacteria bacterium SURF_17 TaxID=2093361 RepID=A0A419ERG9_9BACT|nr:MAG: ABC transporter ATP-binding protein [Candidatus Abyssubacteria bacterium SURF_17]